MAIVTSIGSVIEYFVTNPSLLVVGFLLYVFIFVLSILFSSPKPGKNPFSADHIKPRKPLVTNQTARDAVIKQRFKASKVDKKFDVIIIGSGAGGLATAVLLSRAGKKVLVLEQHDQAGGSCHTFIEKGFEFDTGIHYVGDMGAGCENRILMDQLTDGQLDWASMDEAYDIVAIGEPEKVKWFPIKAGANKFADNLKELFPKEKATIDKYIQLLEAERGKISGMVILKYLPRQLAKILVASRAIHFLTSFFKNQKTVKEVVDSLTDNDELKTVISYIFGDYGVPPAKASWFFHAVVTNHYRNGAFYPVGGTSEIAFTMVPIIERHGGRVLVSAPVSRILFENGRACGVAVQKTSGEIEIKANTIISDAGFFNTLTRLMPKEIAMKTSVYSMLKTNKLPPSISYITAFIGFRGTTEELGINASNTWYYRSPDVDGASERFLEQSINEITAGDIPMMFISFPSAKDISWEDRYDGISVGLIITLCKYEWFKEWEELKVKHRGDEYESIKNAIGKQMLRSLFALYPKLDDKVEYFEVGSPLSNKFYLGYQEGEMYGVDHCAERFAAAESMNLRPDIGIPGLLLTGQDILTCGLTGATSGALLTASKYLNRNIFSDLAKFKKSLKKNE